MEEVAADNPEDYTAAGDLTPEAIIRKAGDLKLAAEAGKHRKRAMALEAKVRELESRIPGPGASAVNGEVVQGEPPSPGTPAAPAVSVDELKAQGAREAAETRSILDAIAALKPENVKLSDVLVFLKDGTLKVVDGIPTINGEPITRATLGAAGVPGVFISAAGRAGTGARGIAEIYPSTAIGYEKITDVPVNERAEWLRSPAGKAAHKAYMGAKTRS